MQAILFNLLMLSGAYFGYVEHVGWAGNLLAFGTWVILLPVAILGCTDEAIQSTVNNPESRALVTYLLDAMRGITVLVVAATGAFSVGVGLILVWSFILNRRGLLKKARERLKAE